MRTIFSVFCVQLIILILSQFWHFSTSVEFDLHETKMKESFQELLAVKSIKEPYTKFHKTFAKLTVCSLRKAQKSRLCGELARHPNTSWMVLNTDDYEIYRCLRIEFIWPVPPTDDGVLNKISAAPCPPFSIAEDRPYDAPGQNTLLYFVASSTEPKKVLYFAQYDVDEDIMSGGIAYDIDIVCILGDENPNCEHKVEGNTPEKIKAEDIEAEENKTEEN